MVGPPGLVLLSNILRNLQTSNRLRFRANADAFVEIVARMLRAKFDRVEENRRLQLGQRVTDVDVVLYEGGTLYLIECKHSVPGASIHEMRDGEKQLNVYEGDDIVAKWFDWLDGLTERYSVQLPMPTGQCLQIRAKTIDDFAMTTGSSFCWICCLTAYHRKDTFQLYQEIRDYREYGCSRISID